MRRPDFGATDDEMARLAKALEGPELATIDGVEIREQTPGDQLAGLRGERKFGWDALPDVSTSIIPELVECDRGVPVGSGGAESRSTGQRRSRAKTVGMDPTRRVPTYLHSERSDSPTALPSVLGQEAINIVFALCLAAGTVVTAAVSHMGAPDRQVKVYTERME